MVYTTDRTTLLTDSSYAIILPMDIYRRRSGGYTIIEVTIVLTVSALLFASAITAYSEQNRRTAFTESVNTFAQNIQDVLNDVETGFVASGDGISCTITGGQPDLEPDPAVQQGTNAGCTFLGKAIQFAPDRRRMEMDVYTIVGRTFNEDVPPEPVTSINEARPTAIPAVEDSRSLTSGVEIVDLLPGGAGIAMVSNSNTSSGISTGLNSRASLALVGGSLGNPGGVFRASVGAINTDSINNANNGVRICLQEQGGGREAVIELTGGQSQIVVNVRIDQSC